MTIQQKLEVEKIGLQTNKAKDAFKKIANAGDDAIQVARRVGREVFGRHYLKPGCQELAFFRKMRRRVKYSNDTAFSFLVALNISSEIDARISRDK